MGLKMMKRRGGDGGGGGGGEGKLEREGGSLRERG